MLAVFDKSVAKCPEALQSPRSGSASALKDGFLAQQFASVHPSSVTVNLGASGLIAYSLDRQNPLLPRLFAVVDDIFCLFQGHIENVALLKQQYGLNKTANEVIIVIEAFRTLRDRGPYPADQVVRDIQGKFAFVLFDSASKATFIATVSKPPSVECVLNRHLPFLFYCQVLVISFFPLVIWFCS
ncbi:stem-specific protein TSJT1-like [Pyrus ussuriensis x Pyrus communis]|uniref:Stem-specific protein TSJT1-like n=1 Tax=Pyrus ussuriensis x Pyrus communis TaxID=2448454 RepID=A0A5N5HC73_9ROSA|nr:stem-specific protein TSJT1-like [Pyrus ussuriensis x Pyrus communis]